jgi:hypothetical protein
VRSNIFDLSALILVIVSNGNLLVNRIGVSLIISLAVVGDDGDCIAVGGANIFPLFFAELPALPPPLLFDADAEDDGKRHLLYIVAVGRLNGIILQR